MSFTLDDNDGSLISEYAFFEIAESYQLDIGEALADVVDEQLGLLDEEYSQAGTPAEAG